MGGIGATNTSVQELPEGQAQNSRSPGDDDGNEAPAPPLPPRPAGIDRQDHQPPVIQAAGQSQRSSLRPPLRTHTTTAVSLTDILTHFHSAGTRETFSTATHQPKNGSTNVRPTAGQGENEVLKKKKKPSSEVADTASISSYIPASEGIGEVESLLGDVLRPSDEPTDQAHICAPFGVDFQDDEELGQDFLEEFKELEPLEQGGANQGLLHAPFFLYGISFSLMVVYIEHKKLFCEVGSLV